MQRQNGGQRLIAKIRLPNGDGDLLVWGKPLETNTHEVRQIRTIAESTFAHSCAPGRIQLVNRSPLVRVLHCQTCGLVVQIDSAVVTLRELANSLNQPLLEP